MHHQEKMQFFTKKTLDELNAPQSKVIMTSNLGEKGKDEQSWDQYYLSSQQREQEAEKFKSSDDPTKILIVVDMLLVGYDAPICQVFFCKELQLLVLFVEMISNTDPNFVHLFLSLQDLKS